MRISVALCTYNGASYLDEQLDSIARQTRLPDELIISDDCSVDTTPSIVESFAHRAPFPVGFQMNETNLGSCRNFEKAIRKCSGEIIALCDQDDVWLPHKLSVFEKMFLGDPVLGLVFSDAELVDGNLVPLGKRLWDYTLSAADRKRFKRGLALQVLCRRNVITGATMAFRSCYSKLCLPIPALEGLVHDYWIALVIGSQSKISFVPAALIKYRQHDRQQLGIIPGLGIIPDLRTRWSYAESMASIREDLARISKLKETVRNAQFLNESSSLHSEDPRSILYRAFADHEDHLRELSAHYRARQELPQNRWQRVPAVLREFRTGRYTCYSRGLLSALKDLLV